ncbi:hypothetical protein O6H91_07G010300 [Diphasiastrum complanatum]|uniref:Uncharacterized protein n=3 Tax=Diphasiastrum complanatum TaxID=34168 RepID=A0ACC2D2B1_DIPCM|nr:hypothetical protein O6H91_07G010300 [Diphasiastrum complanatum]
MFFRRVTDSPYITSLAKVRRSCEEGHLSNALQTVVQQPFRWRMEILLSLLQSCIQEKNLKLGRQVHALISRSGLNSNVLLGNHLIRMFSVGGSLLEANQAFHNLQKKDSYTWREIISANSKHGKGEQAIKLYHEMCQSETRPNDYVYVAALKACASVSALSQGRLIHAHILERRSEASVFVGNAVVDMYARCGSVSEAKTAFRMLPERDVASFNALIGGCVQQGYGREALQLFRVLQAENLVPNNITFVHILRACGSMAALNLGKIVHAQIIKSNLESDDRIGYGLVDMYAKCGNLEEAHQVFQNLQHRDAYSWTAMIAGFSQHGHGQEAVQLFQKMQQEGFKPNNINYASVLKACSSIGALDEGRCIHTQIIENGLESDFYIGNTLVDMYAKCGDLDKAREVLHKLPKRSVVSWTALIAGYSRQGCGVEALELFKEMQQEGVRPDKVTFASIFKACGSMAFLDEGRLVHAQLMESRVEWDSFIGSTLIDMYVKCKSLDEAQKVFRELPHKDIVSWTTLITGFAEHGRGWDALNLFQVMQTQGFSPNIVTFIAVLKVCGSTAALSEGRLIHSQLKDMGLESNVHVASCLIDMYAKCGSLPDAFEVFYKLRHHDVVTWTAMIAGCALHGHFCEALQLFKKMQGEGFRPNKVTFVCVLSVCSRTGQIDEGYHLFEYMCEAFGICPVREHYTCIADLFGRAGDLHNAEAFIDKILMV